MNQPPTASISSRRAVRLCAWLLLCVAVVFGSSQARASLTRPTFQTPQVIALSFAPQVPSEPRFKLEITTGILCGNDPVNRHDPLGLEWVLKSFPNGNYVYSRYGNGYGSTRRWVWEDEEETPQSLVLSLVDVLSVDLSADVMGAPLSEVAEVWMGYEDAGRETVDGLGFMVAHPMQAGEGLLDSALNPIQTFNTVKRGVLQDVTTTRGKGKLFGNFLLGIATDGVGKSFGLARKLPRSSRLPKTTGRFGGVTGATAAERSFLNNVRATFGDGSVFTSAARHRGNIVIQRSDISLSIQNLRRMKSGNSPFVRNAVGEWETLNLHHVGRQDGQMIEVFSSHNTYNPATGGPLHIPGPGGPVRQLRLSESYWQQRLDDFINSGQVSDDLLRQLVR